jgi:hypothetical protein
MKKLQRPLLINFKLYKSEQWEYQNEMKYFFKQNQSHLIRDTVKREYLAQTYFSAISNENILAQTYFSASTPHDQ